jgi:hypothetical protein
LPAEIAIIAALSERFARRFLYRRPGSERLAALRRGG